MRWSFLGRSDASDGTGPPDDTDIAAATVRATEASALCTRPPRNHNFGRFAEFLQDG
jgi:hypothetical protein